MPCDRLGCHEETAQCAHCAPGCSGAPAVSPTRVGSPASPGPPLRNTHHTRQSHSRVRASGAGGRVSVATGVFVPVAVFRGRRHLEVIIEDAQGPGQCVLGLLADGRALSRRGWPHRRPRRGGRRMLAAPPAFALSQEEHPDRLARDADDGQGVGCGDGEGSPAGRSVRWRLEVKALPLGRCLPGYKGCHSWSTSSCAGWRREIQEGPQICCRSAFLWGRRWLNGAESRFLWGVHTCRGGGLDRSLAWRPGPNYYQ